MDSWSLVVVAKRVAAAANMTVVVVAAVGIVYAFPPARLSDARHAHSLPPRPTKTPGKGIPMLAFPLPAVCFPNPRYL